MAEARKKQIKTHKVNSTQIEHRQSFERLRVFVPTAHSLRLSTQSNYLSLQRLNGLAIRMKKNIEQSNEFEFNFLIHRKRRVHCSAPAHSDQQTFTSHHITDIYTAYYTLRLHRLHRLILCRRARRIAGNGHGGLLMPVICVCRVIWMHPRLRHIRRLTRRTRRRLLPRS